MKFKMDLERRGKLHHHQEGYGHLGILHSTRKKERESGVA
jgi:hypothetical protein